jgi:general secretion pathway protein I
MNFPGVSGRQAGFTLLELLVAFMVLVLAFTVMLRIFSGGLRGVGDAQAHSRAVEHARSQLALMGTEHPLSPGELTGETADGYRWQVTAEPVAASELPRQDAGQSFQSLQALEQPELLRVTARVSWGAAPQRTVSLWTLALQEADGPGLAGAGRRP